MRVRFAVAACAQLVAALLLPVCGQTAGLTVLAPNGGETFHVGDTMYVRWSADTTRVGAVNIEISFDAGNGWNLLTSSHSVYVTDSTWGDYRWVVPESLATVSGTISTLSASCLVRVWNYVGHSPQDESNALFAIAAVSAPPAQPQDHCGCGADASAAIIPPVFFSVASWWRRRRKRPPPS
jgi:hypothetical protein